MLMYSLLEYGDNCSVTSGSSWKYYRDEMNEDANEINTDSYRINNIKQQQVDLLSLRSKYRENTRR